VDEEMLEFCRECGMEFLDGFETECPLCGAEQEDLEGETPRVLGQPLDDDEKCAVCKQWYTLEDEAFWEYWEEFDSPDWLSIDDVWCRTCIIKRLNTEYPELHASGLEPGTYLVWRDALSMGIDLGPRLTEIEMNQSVWRLVNCAVSREDIIQVLSSDCPIDEAVEWLNIFDDFETAATWRKAGFHLDEVDMWLRVSESVETCIRWREAGFSLDDDPDDWARGECSPVEALSLRAQGHECPPPIEFKTFGVSIFEALHLDAAGLEPDNFGHFDSLGGWLSSGLKPPEIVTLRTEIAERILELERIHREIALSESERAKYPTFRHFLPVMIRRLSSVGLPVTAENLLKYWGLQDRTIIASIDKGLDNSRQNQWLQRGVSPSKVALVERLLRLGVSEETSLGLVRRDLRQRHLKSFADEVLSPGHLNYLYAILVTDNHMTVDEAQSWMNFGFSPRDFLIWRKCGFRPDEACEWRRAGFDAEESRQWRSSGAKSPAIAGRRREAGIKPQS